MLLQKNKGFWNVFDKSIEIARVSDFTVFGEQLFGAIQFTLPLSIQKKKAALNLFSKEIRKEFPSKTVQLFLKENQLKEHETDVCFTLNRVRIYRSLENIPEFQIKEGEIHSLNFENIDLMLREFWMLHLSMTEKC